MIKSKYIVFVMFSLFGTLFSIQSYSHVIFFDSIQKDFGMPYVVHFSDFYLNFSEGSETHIDLSACMEPSATSYHELSQIQTSTLYQTWQMNVVDSSYRRVIHCNDNQELIDY